MLARLVIDDLTLVRGERQLFQAASFTVEAGEAVVLTGENGVGKTSLLRAAAGLIRPEGGRIAFLDGAATELDPDAVRGGELHLLGHHDGLKATRTAREELAFWAAWLGGDARALGAAIERFDLAPLLSLDVRKLSAGQRRRLSLARLLAAPRPLWLLDEPLAPLDAARRLAFAAVMADHLAGGGLILAAVHDPLPMPTRAIRLHAPIVGAVPA